MGESPVRSQDRTSTYNVSTALIKTNGYGIKDAKSEFKNKKAKFDCNL